jgi:Ulp1 family protease
MPINVSEMHWVLLAAHVPTLTVSIVDSLNFASGKKYLDKWR